MPTAPTDPTNPPWATFTARLYAQNLFAIKLGLDPIRRALTLRGPPNHPVILVAGTNGKGTTSCALAALLQACGLRTGLYTSPHLIDLTERFRLQGTPLTPAQVLPLGQEILEAFGQPSLAGDPPLTFFELTTLLAVALFNRHQVDVGIYEVGLGGRLDATNALDPSLSVIATLGFDHQAYLGHTLPLILAEKLGIARPEVPLLLGAQDYPEVFEHLASQPIPHAHTHLFGHDFDLLSAPSHPDRIVSCGHTFPIPPTSGAWPVPHQRRHWALAVHAAQTWLGRPLTAAEFDHAFHHSQWPGRFDLRIFIDRTTQQSWSILLDGAHNPDGSRVLFQTLRAQNMTPAAILCGAMADKDLPGLFAPLMAPPFQEIPLYAVAIDSPRAACADTLRDCLPHLRHVGPLPEVMRAVFEQTDPHAGPILVFGSLYLIGECLRYMGLNPADLSLWKGR